MPWACRLAAGVLYPVFGWLLNPMIAGAAMSFSSVSGHHQRPAPALASDCQVTENGQGDAFSMRGAEKIKLFARNPIMFVVQYKNIR